MGTLTFSSGTQLPVTCQYIGETKASFLDALCGLLSVPSREEANVKGIICSLKLIRNLDYVWAAPGQPGVPR